MNTEPPEQAIGAMLVLTAIAVLLVVLCETVANWLR
jgi:hypothetical protein